MNATRRPGLALVFLALTGAAGCGAAMAPKGMSAPEAPSSAEKSASGPAGYPQAPASMSSPGAAPSMDSVGREASAPPPPPAAPSAGAAAARKAEVAPQPEDRPGLGTQWGETRSSRISTVPFVRDDASSPFGVASLFYNDEEGARAMASGSGFRRTPAGSFTVSGGIVSVGLRDERGSFLNGFVAGDKNFVVGEAGHRYTIVIRNNTDSRLECVVSVDGLDVLDGKAAAFGKRGYLVDPRGELEVDGFRQSTETVAAFRFGSVRGSYANQKHGDTRNVGVIGLALFNERGTRPVPFNQEDANRRKDANPFPGQFATPPGQ